MWQPDATEVGVEAIYVMVSKPYGESNAKGKYSGRDFHTEKAGGPIQNLDWKTAKIDRAGVGVEAIYVMISKPYGETNAKGKHSGRDYNTEKAGGPIQNLDWKTARIDRAGVDKVKLHIGRFTESDANKVMLGRLDKILRGELVATDTDKRFYTHEIRELERYRNLDVKDGALPNNPGETWNNIHTATLEDYKLGNAESLLYTPEAIKSE